MSNFSTKEAVILMLASNVSIATSPYSMETTSNITK